MNKMKTLTLQGIPFEVVDGQARNDIEVLKESGGASSWNDLKDKPFYEETEVINEPLNIAWDGNTEGLVAFEGILYKVSDAILSDEQIKNATISMSDGQTIFIGDDWDVMNSGGMITDDVVALIEGLAVIVRVAGAIWRDRVFPEAGIYFIGLESIHVSSLAVPAEIKTTVHKLDKKYLPEHLQFGTEVTETYGDTLTWDGNTDGLYCAGSHPEAPSYRIYKISDTTPMVADMNNGVGVIHTTSGGETRTSIPISITGFTKDGTMLAGAIEHPASDIAIATQSLWAVCYEENSIYFGVNLAEKGVYICKAEGEEYINSLTIPNYTGFKTVTETITKLDKKYLPDVSDLDADWLAELQSALQNLSGGK